MTDTPNHFVSKQFGDGKQFDAEIDKCTGTTIEQRLTALNERIKRIIREHYPSKLSSK